MITADYPGFLENKITTILTSGRLTVTGFKQPSLLTDH